MTTLCDAAVLVLSTADPVAKAQASRRAAAAWRDGAIVEIGQAAPPPPARPEKPELRLPRDMPKRGRGRSESGRIALLHALAHIELNAIDLAWDAVARYAGHAEAGAPLPRAFFDDWVRVGDEEGLHFLMLSERLAAYGAAYGNLPAHAGLWQSAEATAHDLAARLAVVPMVLEARGLDVTPAMIANLREIGDDASADALQRIHDDEIGHVAAGRRWFEWACAQRGVDPLPTWRHLVRTYFKGVLKRPFNVESRDKAGLKAAFYESLADRDDEDDV